VVDLIPPHRLAVARTHHRLVVTQVYQVVARVRQVVVYLVSAVHLAVARAHHRHRLAVARARHR
jgi:hypothetical protein